MGKKHGVSFWVVMLAVMFLFICSAEAKEAIRIGVVHNYTDLSGRSIKEGAIMAQEEFNKEGGIFVKGTQQKTACRAFLCQRRRESPDIGFCRRKIMQQ